MAGGVHGFATVQILEKMQNYKIFNWNKRRFLYDIYGKWLTLVMTLETIIHIKLFFSVAEIS
jgi:hypothetical protein